MRFFYTLLIGLLIFNSMIIAFAVFFPQSDEHRHADDMTDTDFAEGPTKGVWQRIAGLDSTGGAGVAVAIGSFVGMALVGWITKQYALFLGVGVYISTVALIWADTSGIISRLTSDYAVVSDIMIIITIGLTALFIFSIIEMFNAQKGVN
jgi:hypothetical protein